MPKRGGIVGVRTAMSILADDAVFGNGSDSRNNAEAQLRSHIPQLEQSIVEGTIAENGNHNTTSAIGLQQTQTLQSQSRHPSGKYRHGYYC